MRVRTIDYKPDRKLKTDTRSENNIYTVLVEFVEHALRFKEIAELRKTSEREYINKNWNRADQLCKNILSLQKESGLEEKLHTTYFYERSRPCPSICLTKLCFSRGDRES